MQEAIIEFKDFSFKYNALAQPTLNNINLKIYPKEKVLIVGTSGCGKSTLVNCINGLIPFTYKGEISGTLTIKGKKTIDHCKVKACFKRYTAIYRQGGKSRRFVSGGLYRTYKINR